MFSFYFMIFCIYTIALAKMAMKSCDCIGVFFLLLDYWSAVYRDKKNEENGELFSHGLISEFHQSIACFFSHFTIHHFYCILRQWNIIHLFNLEHEKENIYNINQKWGSTLYLAGISLRDNNNIANST